MANTCNNRVQFLGSDVNINQIISLFSKMATRQEKEDIGLLPSYIQNDTGFFYAVRLEGNTVYYETRWAPNTITLVALAKGDELAFIHCYEEVGMKIYGCALYRDRFLQYANLEDTDFDMYSYEPTNNRYVFDGSLFETENEILEILLNRKVALMGLNV